MKKKIAGFIYSRRQQQKEGRFELLNVGTESEHFVLEQFIY